jgi:hypothetical protein
MLALNGRLQNSREVCEFVYCLNVFRLYNKDMYVFAYQNDFKYGLIDIHQNTNYTKDTKFSAHNSFRFYSSNTLTH